MPSDERCLVRYLGSESEVVIAPQIEKIGDGCFRAHEMDAVTFASTSTLTSIGVQAFWNCQNLKTMTIPSSVSFLGNCCFGFCASLATVYFAAGSQLEVIPEAAFSTCRSRRSLFRHLSKSSTTIALVTASNFRIRQFQPIRRSFESGWACSRIARHCDQCSCHRRWNLWMNTASPDAGGFPV
jgi:hypothetical protein